MCKELLSNPNGYLVNDVIERGHEVIHASHTSLKNMSAPLATTVNVVTRSSCSSCGLHPPPKSYPVYKDRCLACGCMGHLEVPLSKFKTYSKKVYFTKTDSQHQRWKESQEVGKEDSKQ